MKVKTYYRFIPILLGLIAFAYFYVYRIVFLNNNYFYRNNVQAKIIRVYNYENKSLQFYYSDDYCITTTDTKNDTLQVGDSISKNANTGEFNIFKKDSFGKYKFYKSYKIE